MKAALSPREKRAITLWGGILVTLGLLDLQQRGASTLTEAHRAFYRRAGEKGWALGWGVFSIWFWQHVRKGAWSEWDKQRPCSGPR